MKFLNILLFLSTLISLPASASEVYTTSFSEQGQEFWLQNERATVFGLAFVTYDLSEYYPVYQSFTPLVGVPISVPRGPTFDGISNLLTNGVLDALHIDIGNLGHGGPENVFFGGAFEDRPTDFAGYRIDDISLTINRFELLSPTGYDVPWNLRTWITEGTVSLTVSKSETSVPEPSSAALLIFGGLMLCFGVRKNKARAPHL